MFVLSLLTKGTPEEMAMELMELKGVSSQDGVRELTVQIEKELHKMQEEHLVQLETETDGKIRYRFSEEKS